MPRAPSDYKDDEKKTAEKKSQSRSAHRCHAPRCFVLYTTPPHPRLRRFPAHAASSYAVASAEQMQGYGTFGHPCALEVLDIVRETREAAWLLVRRLKFKSAENSSTCASSVGGNAGYPGTPEYPMNTLSSRPHVGITMPTKPLKVSKKKMAQTEANVKLSLSLRPLTRHGQAHSHNRSPEATL
ncbi:hypothetical protein DPEC_G00268660 [Dallia pectoralis]|uniref:Uncharacterized protein n=1 Tax=Dallia pectoralis TaxID=75939 RepID=A0ACC2FNY6_DALPE|nr:hypothetical protein DPEC_G00268660 [Dallia pectoralis]